MPSTRLLIALAVCYAALMLGFLGTRQISRAQEARVLETSRQMLASPDWRGWMVPQLNGEARLRKPPLCYWYTAASYEAFGVNEFAGRLPTLLLGFATIGVTFAFGRDLMGRRGGFFAAAVLASGYFFIRFARSAETDTPAMLGTILACWAIVRATQTSRIAWNHLAAVGIALSAMTKGGPAVYPIVFLALYAIAQRSWRPIVRFALSGAPLLFAALVLPWFLYVLRDPASAQVAQEIRVVTTGSNHFGLFYQYVPIALIALLPWTGLFVVAFIAVAQTFLSVSNRRFAGSQAGMPVPLVVVCAIACVALPLCVTLNVQQHYLLPALPACALLIGWMFDRATDGGIATSGLRASNLRAFRVAFAVTAALGFVLGPAILATAYLVHHRVGWLDVVAAGVLFGSSVVLFGTFRRRPADAQLVGLAAAMCVVMPVVAGWWAPTLNGERSRETAAAVVATFGDRPLAVYGDDVDISLNFALRRATPLLHDESAVRGFFAAHPDGVILYTPSKRVPTPAVLATLARNDLASDLQSFQAP